MHFSARRPVDQRLYSQAVTPLLMFGGLFCVTKGLKNCTTAITTEKASHSETQEESELPDAQRFSRLRG